MGTEDGQHEEWLSMGSTKVLCFGCFYFSWNVLAFWPLPLPFAFRLLVVDCRKAMACFRRGRSLHSTLRIVYS